MKVIPFATTAVALSLLSGNACAQAAEDPAVNACKSTGLLALQERSPDITDLVMDMESLAISKADTKVEDVPVKTVILGELLGEKGKVLLTFFTAQ